MLHLMQRIRAAAYRTMGAPSFQSSRRAGSGAQHEPAGGDGRLRGFAWCSCFALSSDEGIGHRFQSLSAVVVFDKLDRP
jgi:hypothetical protein